MSKVIESFLVSLGFDVDEKSTKESQKSIDDIKGGALKMGAALAASLAGAGYIAKTTAKDMAGVYDQARLLADVGGEELYILQDMFELAGGSASDAEGALKSFQSLLTDIRTFGKEGQLGDLQLGGINPDLIMGARNSIDLLEKLAKIYPTLTETQQGTNDDILGLNHGAKLLLRAGDQYEKLRDRAIFTGTRTEEELKQSKELTQAFTELGQAWDGVLEGFTVGVAPAMTEAVEDLTDLFVNLQDTAKWFGELFGDSFTDTKDFTQKLKEGGLQSVTAGDAQKFVSASNFVLNPAGWVAMKAGKDWASEYIENTDVYNSFSAPNIPLVNQGGESTKSYHFNFGDTNVQSQNPNDGRQVGNDIFRALEDRLQSILSGVQG